jgi:hypothetical protein
MRADMTSSKEFSLSNSDDLSPELVPVVDPGATALTLPSRADAASGEPALGDLLSDALFGEVIDISDIIHSVLTAPIETTALGAVAEAGGTAERGPADSGEILPAASNAVPLTILYDDDVLVSDAIL